MPPNNANDINDNERKMIETDLELKIKNDFPTLKLQKPDVVYKVLIIGESRIGKTSMIRKLSNNEFKETTISTVGLDFVNIDFNIENVHVRLQIWDTAGQENFRSITRNYFRNTKGIVLVYDITEESSLEQLKYWIEQMEYLKLNSETTYLVGNKRDLEAQREVSQEKGKKLASENAIKFFETSARTGEYLIDIFYNLAIDLLENNDINLVEKFQVANGHEKPWMFNYNPKAVIYVPETQIKKDRFRRIFQKKPKKSKTEELNLSVEKLGNNKNTIKKATLNSKNANTVEPQGCCILS